MKTKIFLCSDLLNLSFFITLLSDYEVSVVSTPSIINNNIKNKNILFIYQNRTDSIVVDNLILNNSVLIFSLNQKFFFKTKTIKKPTSIYGPTEVCKFLSLVKSAFQFKEVSFGDVKIFENKIINIKNNKSCFLTDLEKKILFAFIEKKQIRRDYFLEEILKIKKNVETKTIESHLTRIRKKIKKIDSEINISSKSEVFFINF